MIGSSLSFAQFFVVHQRKVQASLHCLAWFSKVRASPDSAPLCARTQHSDLLPRHTFPELLGDCDNYVEAANALMELFSGHDEKDEEGERTQNIVSCFLASY